MKLPAVPLVCSSCGATFGALLPLDRDMVRAHLAGTFLAGISGMLPADMAGTLAPILKTECGACFLRRIQDATTEDASGGHAAGRSDRAGRASEPAQADAREDTDEEGNRRLIGRGRFGRRRP